MAHAPLRKDRAVEQALSCANQVNGQEGEKQDTEKERDERKGVLNVQIEETG